MGRKHWKSKFKSNCRRKEIFKDINLKVNKGKKSYNNGPNGAGQIYLANVIR